MAANQKKVVRTRRKEKKNIEKGQVHINSTFNNSMKEPPKAKKELRVSLNTELIFIHLCCCSSSSSSRLTSSPPA